MPSRNVLRVDVAEMYYHVYARGASRQTIFSDDEDYRVFLNLLKRYLSKDAVKDRQGREYANFYDSLELIAYCLMPNHFHLFIYQHDAEQISRLMRMILTSYTRHFNTKYHRSGPLFESRFKASHITSDAYLMHISRYIHLNPKDWRNWQWSSLSYFSGSRKAAWVRPGRVMELFDDNRDRYLRFVDEYVDRRDELKNTVSRVAANM